MPMFEIQGSDGEVYEVEAPDQQKALDAFRSLQGTQQPAQPQQASPWERGTILPVEVNKETGERRFAMPTMVEGILDAVRLPGDTYAGRVPDLDPRLGAENVSDETFARTFNAGALMAPSTPAARINMAPTLSAAQKGANKRIAAGLAADQIPVGQAQQRLNEMGPGAMVMDLGPNLQQKAGGIATVPGAGQRTLISAVEQRAAQAGARVQDDVARAVGRGAPAVQMLDEITQAQSAAAKPLYDAVRNQPLEATGGLRMVITTPMGKRAFQKAIDMSANDGVPVNGLTVGLVDYAKRVLDDIASSAARAGNNNEARQARTLAQLLVSEADKAVPAYQQARQAFAGPAAVKDAIEMGRGIFNKSLPPAELQRQLRTMTTSERDALIQGARSAFEEMMGNAVNDSLAVRNALRRGFNREKLSMILGEEAVEGLIKAMDREIVFGKTTNAVAGNSLTAARQAAQAEAAPGMARTQPVVGWLDAALRTFDAARNKLASGNVNRANEEMARILSSGRIPDVLTAPAPSLPARIAPPAMLASGRGIVADRFGRATP